MTMLNFIPRNNSPLGSFPTKFTNPAGPGFPFLSNSPPTHPLTNLSSFGTFILVKSYFPLFKKKKKEEKKEKRKKSFF